MKILYLRGTPMITPRFNSLIVLTILLASGCSTTYQPTNQPLTTIDETSGYRKFTATGGESSGDNLVLLAFSGGGTRAAALSYGVMQELRDTLIPDEAGTTSRLLDQVDSISSVSGGSFTAAYYGLYRDRLFEDFEKDFLRLDVQGALLRRLVNPMNWIRGAAEGFDRTEMAVSYYDQKIFNRATFSDMAAMGPPFIDINATDLTNGLRFTFNQDTFDLICTDLSSYSVARAVTASSAVPVVFPPIVIQNHADKCDVTASKNWQLLNNRQASSEAQSTLIDGMKSYIDSEDRPYIHLIDGGISDNLGLRVTIDRVEGLGESRFSRLAENGTRNILVILVNAEVKPERLIGKSAKKPTVSDTMSAYTSAQMTRYNQETLDRLKQHLTSLNELATQKNLSTRLYFAEVSFDGISAASINRFLNSMPTSLQLEDIDVDRLTVTGRMLLRHEPSFVAFKQRNKAVMAEGAITDNEICRHFEVDKCQSELN